jgi:hypothetical protein
MPIELRTERACGRRAFKEVLVLTRDEFFASIAQLLLPSGRWF